jgi:type IV pilus assembly protein PilW
MTKAVRVQQNENPDSRILIGRSAQGGVTLVELLVALCIMAVMSVAIFGLMATLRRSFTTQSVASGVQESVRTAIDYMAEDIRMAGYDPKNKADARIEALTATSLRFTSDRNGNAEIENTDRERITFVYDAPNRRLQQVLYEGTASASTEVLISNVSGVTFSYFDQNGAVTVEPDDVRTVEVLLTVEQSAGRDGLLQRSYTTRVKCRNIGL